MLSKIKEIIAANTEDDILYKKWDTKHKDEYFSKVYWHYHPATEKYFFEANPSFFHEYKNMFDCGRFPLVMLRDGFVGILEFFLVHPIPPKDFRSIVLINKRFSRLIPLKWKNYVVTYSITERKQDIIKEKNDLLVIYGFGTEDVFWGKSPRKLLEKYASISQEYKQTVCVFPQRESMLSSEKEQSKNYALQLIKETYKNFGFDVKMALDSQKFFENNKLDNFSFINLDQLGVFISDNYIDHYLYRSGGRSLNTVYPREEEALEYNLSANHKVIIEEVNFNDNVFSEFYIQYRILGAKELSLYKVYQSMTFKELFLKHFTSNI
jgi:hypothetical protein